MTTYNFTLSIGFSGAIQQEEFTVEDMGLTQNEWNKLNEDTKNKILQQEWKEWINDYIDGGWKEIKDKMYHLFWINHRKNKPHYFSGTKTEIEDKIKNISPLNIDTFVVKNDKGKDVYGYYWYDWFHEKKPHRIIKPVKIKSYFWKEQL